MLLLCYISDRRAHPSHWQEPAFFAGHITWWCFVGHITWWCFQFARNRKGPQAPAILMANRWVLKPRGLPINAPGTPLLICLPQASHSRSTQHHSAHQCVMLSSTVWHAACAFLHMANHTLDNHFTCHLISTAWCTCRLAWALTSTIHCARHCLAWSRCVAVYSCTPIAADGTSTALQPFSLPCIHIRASHTTDDWPMAAATICYQALRAH